MNYDSTYLYIASPHDTLWSSTVSPPTTTDYHVLAQNQDGCMAMGQTTVTVFDCVCPQPAGVFAIPGQTQATIHWDPIPDLVRTMVQYRPKPNQSAQGGINIVGVNGSDTSITTVSYTHLRAHETS